MIAKGTHIYYVKGYGMLVHAAHYTCIERIAKATALRISNGLEGEKIVAADSAGAAFSGGKLPNYGTWVDPLIREAYRSIKLDLYAEAWVEAQHDSGAKEFLAYCNNLTDDVATEELEKAKNNVVFLPKEWVKGPVFSIKGQIVVDLSVSLDKLYNDEMKAKARDGLEGWNQDWSSYDQMKAMQEGSLSIESLKSLTLLRVAGMEVERYCAKQSCKWCGEEGTLGAIHLHGKCPVFYLRRVHMMMWLMGEVEKLGDWALTNVTDLEVCFKRTGEVLWVSVLADKDQADYKSSKGNDQVFFLGWSGWYFTSGPWKNHHRGSPFPLDEFFKGWNESNVLTLTEVLRQLTKREELRSAGDMHPWAKLVHTEAPRTLRESVLVSWLVRGLDNWRMVTKGRLAVQLPITMTLGMTQCQS